MKDMKNLSKADKVGLILATLMMAVANAKQDPTTQTIAHLIECGDVLELGIVAFAIEEAGLTMEQVKTATLEWIDLVEARQTVANGMPV